MRAFGGRLRNSAGGLLIVEVDAIIYAIGYGKGHYWLNNAKDPGSA